MGLSIRADSLVIPAQAEIQKVAVSRGLLGLRLRGDDGAGPTLAFPVNGRTGRTLKAQGLRLNTYGTTGVLFLSTVHLQSGWLMAP